MGRVRRTRTVPNPAKRRLGGDSSRPAAFASDLDRTLVRTGGPVTDAARTALGDARRLGLRTVIVSGREYDKLVPFAHALGSVDAIVAENGAVVEAPLGRRPTVVAGSFARVVRQRLAGASGISPRFGTVVVSVPIRQHRRLVRALEGLPVHFLPNVDRVMALPPGIDKGTGVRLALSRFGGGRGDYAALGDGENDLDLLQGAALSGAVANAQPIVRAAADYVCRGHCARGALEFVRGPLAAWASGTAARGRPRGGRRASGRAPR